MDRKFSGLMRYWSPTKDDNFNFFPEDIDMLWLGNNKILMLSTGGGWYILNVFRHTITQILDREEEHPALEEGDALLNTEIILNEEQRRFVNSYLRHEDPDPVQMEHVTFEREIVTAAPCLTLRTDINARELEMTAWALRSYTTSCIRYPEIHREDSEEDVLEVMPYLWTVTIEGEQIGEFISHTQPCVGFDEENQLWTVFVQRYDCGLDGYRLKPARSL